MATVREGGERRIPMLDGRAWALGLDLPAVLILPPEHRDSAHPSRFLLTGVDPGFPSRVAPGDMVVGGGDFARGTDHDGPVRAFLEARIGAVIACSFDARFATLSAELGLPAVCVLEALAIHTGARLRVDLEGARVVNLSSGDRYPIRNLSDSLLERLRLHYA